MIKVNIPTITSKSLKEKKYIDLIPEYYQLAYITENNTWHNQQNVLDHVIKVFCGLEKILKFDKLNPTSKKLIEKYLSIKIGNQSRKNILIVATLLHDIAKINTLIIGKDGTTCCPGHELIGASRVKKYSALFDLDKKAEQYVELIVRYHGFIGEIVNLIIQHKNKEKYLKIFQETVSDVDLELVLFTQAELLGLDIQEGNKKTLININNLLSWLLNKILKERSIYKVTNSVCAL